MLAASGVQVAIITGRNSPMVQRRAEGLGISRIKLGREDKMAALQELLAQEPCPLEAIACMGMTTRISPL